VIRCAIEIVHPTTDDSCFRIHCKPKDCSSEYCLRSQTIPTSEFLCALRVNDKVAFTGANRPNCRQWPVRGMATSPVASLRTTASYAKFSVSPPWHALLVNCCLIRFHPVHGR
jgi:hypothetical protein